MRADAELVRAAGDGEAAAWEELVDRYATLVYANARAVGADPSLAQDVSQLVWLRLLNRLDTIREPAKVKGWLAIVARNTARNELARRRPSVALDDVLERGDDRAVAPDEAVARADDARAVRRALAQLTDRCRELLTLLFHAELSYDEITEVMGMPIGSIGPTRQRCLASMAAHLDGGVR